MQRGTPAVVIVAAAQHSCNGAYATAGGEQAHCGGATRSSTREFSHVCCAAAVRFPADTVHAPGSVCAAGACTHSVWSVSLAITGWHFLGHSYILSAKKVTLHRPQHAQPVEPAMRSASRRLWRRLPSLVCPGFDAFQQLPLWAYTYAAHLTKMSHVFMLHRVATPQYADKQALLPTAVSARTQLCRRCGSPLNPRTCSDVRVTWLSSSNATRLGQRESRGGTGRGVRGAMPPTTSNTVVAVRVCVVGALRVQLLAVP